MMHARRGKPSAAQPADMWNRWKARQSLHAIGRALGKDHVVIQFLLARRGGIAPPARRRSGRVLTLAEREDILRGIAGGCSDAGHRPTSESRFLHGEPRGSLRVSVCPTDYVRPVERPQDLIWAVTVWTGYL